MRVQFTQMVGHLSLCVIGCCSCVPHMLVVLAVVDEACPSLSLPVGSVFVAYVCGGRGCLLFQPHSIWPLCCSVSSAERSSVASGPGCAASPIPQ